MSASLFTGLSVDEIEGHLLSVQEWRPFPRSADRADWAKLREYPLNAQRSTYLIGAAEALCGINDSAENEKRTLWPELTGVEYMQYIRTGNRYGYETPYFRRRQHLALLILAECMEGRGRFLDEIANGFWAIGSEPTWCLPAHVERTPMGSESARTWDEFPDLHRPTADLFATETGFVLAEGLYLLRAELEARWPGLCVWVDRLIDERVLASFEERDDYWWMHGGNNWAPWCCSNILAAACYTLEDQPRLARLIQKTLAVLQRFYDRYHNDGGCDEGPGYWAVSPGAMLIALEFLHSRTGGKLNFYNDQKIQAMGSYLPSMRMAGSCLVNFADCPASTQVRRAVVYRYGERIHDRTMQETALLAAREWRAENKVAPLLQLGYNGADLMNALRELWWMPADDTPKNAPLPKDVWFPDLQAGMMRSSTTDEKHGLILAFKGGHNAENHNHNDLGQFILMLDGEPGIVDAGVGSYTRKTFSDQRYTNWAIRGSGHNLPVINGHEQIAGYERKSEEVCFNATDAEFSLNAAKAYPEAAGVRAFHRRLCVSRAGKGMVTLTDSYELQQPLATLELNLLSPRQARLRQAGELLLSAATGRELLIRYDPATFSVEITEQDFEDDIKMQQSWPQGLRRIALRYIHAEATGGYRLEFLPEGQ